MLDGHKMERNVRLLYLHVFLNRLEAWLPIVALFLLNKGLSLAEYALVDAVWYVSTLVFDCNASMAAVN